MNTYNKIHSVEALKSPDKDIEETIMNPNSYKSCSKGGEYLASAPVSESKQTVRGNRDLGNEKTQVKKWFDGYRNFNFWSAEI